MTGDNRSEMRLNALRSKPDWKGRSRKRIAQAGITRKITQKLLLLLAISTLQWCDYKCIRYIRVSLSFLSIELYKQF